MKKENLHNINKTGFKTPHNYFETFEADFFERLNEKESINASENSAFTVPNNYFDSVESNVLKKLASTEPYSVTKRETPVVVLKSRRTFYYVASIAASLVLLVSLVINNDNDNLNINAINTASIENYLFLEDYTNEDLATLIITDEISETDFIDVNISENYIDQYIESTDTEDFILD